MKHQIPLIVETYDLGNPDPKFDENGDEIPESVRTIDHSNEDHREWLTRHSYWAFRNGREVRSYPMKKVAA